MKILQVIGSIAPSFGGPAFVARTLHDAWRDGGHETTLLCVADESSEVARWSPGGDTVGVGPGRFGMFMHSPALAPWLHRHAADYDAIVVHGLWQHHGIAVRRAARRAKVPFLTFVHGSLDPWFRDTYPLKHLKKQLYWWLAEGWNVHGAAALVFTCERERRLAHGMFRPYRMNEVVMPIGIADPMALASQRSSAFHGRFPGLRSKRLMLFLGRVHKVKGLEVLVRAFARVAPSDDLLHLVIAGPEVDDTAARARELIAAARLEDRVTWTGMLEGDLKWSAYCAAELFCLPSHSENFGLVVAEALGLGVPVLVSDRVSIHEEILGAHAGLIVEDTVESTVDGLQRWLALTDDERARLRERARGCFAEHFDIRRSIAGLTALVESSARRLGAARG
jgi:glycosyltransferase involved in cell wall biosynthesis